MSQRPHVSRLAPSPTGALHLGNARTFVINWLLARQRRWRLPMRMEDLDGPRVKPQAVSQGLEILAWLGLDCDGPVTCQAQRDGVYRQGLDALFQAGKAYPCTCSRKDILAASSAPHAEDFDGVYPGTCRGRYTSDQAARAETDRPVAWRVAVEDRPIRFEDRIAGRQSWNLARSCGDFVVYRNDGTAAYQLAVVLDDAEAGVDQVVRGDDLLESAARQLYLYELLDLGPRPTYWHLPLVIGPDGRRLAKRHGDTRLVTYRQAGCPPQRILGLLGYWSGLLDRRREADLQDLLAVFDVDRIPPEPVVFCDEDEAFLGC